MAAFVPGFRRSGPALPIASYLVAVILAVALPLLIFCALLLWQLQSSERSALERRTTRDAVSLATNVGRELDDIAVTLRLMATFTELRTGDLQAFHARTQTALRTSERDLILVDADGRQLLNTRVPFGEPLATISDPSALTLALETGRIEVSDVFFGTTSNRWVFNVILPLPEEAQAGGGAALIVTQNAASLGRLVATDGLPAQWSASLIDGSGHTIVSSGGIDPGTPADEAIASRSDFSGVVEDEQAGTIAAFARPPGWSWRAIVSGPVASAQASILTTWKLLLLGGSLLILVAIAGAAWFGARVRRSIGRIADMAERLGRGDVVAPVSTGIAEADVVAVALTNASFDRSQAEEHDRFILHELVHRTKNLLALVQAMIRQSAKHATDHADFQAALGARLEGLGRSIDLLTSDDWQGVSFRRLIETQLAVFLDAPGRLSITGSDFHLRSEAVQNMGLVFHELATNAVKYGALSMPDGRIDVACRRQAADGGSVIVLSWTESGGPRVQRPERKGFGSTIISDFIGHALGAEVALAFNPDGFGWTLTAPEDALCAPASGGHAPAKLGQ